jgi:hypothetical protein
MQQNLEQPDDSRVMDLDAGKTDGADGDRQSNPLKQRKIHVNVEALGLKPAKRSVMIWNLLRTASK